jgi:hypothetical protein
MEEREALSLCYLSFTHSLFLSPLLAEAGVVGGGGESQACVACPASVRSICAYVCLFFATFTDLSAAFKAYCNTLIACSSV